MRTVMTPEGVRLAVHHHSGSGPPALLCHATGFHGAVWEPVAAELGSRLSPWALDFRAHGASVVAEGSPLDWDRFAQDVLAALDGLELPVGATLGVGHSMGGAALVLAELARPGAFRGLWLFEPVIFPPEFAAGGNPLAAGALRRRASFPSRAEALANYAAKPPFSRLRADCLHAYVRHGFRRDGTGEGGGVRLACRPADEARIYEGSVSHGAWSRLGELGLPVVVATGADGGAPALAGAAIAERIPGARLELVPHVGHFGPLEAPAAIAARILAFDPPARAAT